MSKAFTKDDDGSEAPVVPPRRAPLPAGTTNYVTERGLAALTAELASERSRRQSLLHEQAEPRTLAEQALGLAELEARLASAVLVDKALQAHDEVRFGATVTVRSLAGVERRYRIVGVDEANAGRGELAFVAPLARSLLGKRVGEAALVSSPAGEDELEVIAIDYE